MTRPLTSDSRPSLSVSRSQRKEVDFEEALLNASQTKYISTSSPNLDNVDQPVFPDPDAPVPIEKRSFEQDYNGVDSTPVRMVGSPAVIPPTPSTPGSNSRRDSMASSDSAARRLSKLKPLKALGMDEEAAMEDKSSGQKRSIFRSPGTASSPDLATLVRLAKEAKGKSTPPQTINKQSTRQALSRSRATSRASQPDWDGMSNGDVRSVSSGFSGGNRMNTISENSRARQSEDGFKSVRNKAKGMFGRMFGSKDHSSSAPSRMPTQTHPPVPPIPQTYAREVDERRRARSRDADVFGEVQSTTADNGAEESATKGSEKPLPVIQNDEIAPLGSIYTSPDQSLSPTSTQRRTMHSRQPASDAFDHDESRPLTTPQKALASFSEDVNGMFSGIGETHLANELGLPPDSLRVKNRTKSSQSSASEITRRLPTQLAKSSNIDLPGPVPSRTTSLPTTPSLAPLTVNRTPSSPGPATIVRSTTPVSRSSSIKSVKRAPQLEPALADFGPGLINSETTYKPRQREISGSTITGSTYGGASVRLVASPRPPSIYASPASTTNGAEWHKSPASREQTDDSMEVVITPGPGEDDEEKGRRLACELLDDDFSTITYDKAAIFLGGQRPVNQAALRFYMQYFNMQGQILVDSFRDLCRKLHLKAESQEIDRIIEAFSARYFECNPTSVFGNAGVIHTVTGAMLMLNTDLHIADLSKHMSKSDFVRNSMRAVQESMPSNGTDSTPDLVRNDSGSTDTAADSLNTTASVKDRRPRDAPPTNRSASAPVMSNAYNMHLARNRESVVTTSSFSYTKAWEQEAENALKDIYANVKADRILLPTSSLSIPLSPSQKRQSVMSMSSFPDRNRGIRSPSGSRVNALKRGSIIGSQSLLGQPIGSGMSDGRLSPTPSYATSIDETVAHSFAPSFGFASNLTQSVIKEHEDEVRSVDSMVSSDTQDEMNDDEMALLGPPWAKEGMLQTRQYWESAGKKAKKQDWKQVFVVVQKGELNMFTFGSGKGGYSSGTVGGGNWTSNANSAGRLSLMHAVANGLPKPGYNNARPHCVHLTLAGGEGWFLQAGTEELVGEWVQTCNYWAARISRQPLQGGVSNMEYGWSRIHDSNDDDDKASIKSGKSSLSKFTGTYGRRGMPADKIHINDWRPPPPATMPSPLDEENQLDALHVYANRLKEDLASHQNIQEPMSKLYTPGSKNLNKARENWTAKSRYMLTEIHKYETYIEALRAAIALRVKKQGEKKLDRSLRRSFGSLHLLNEDEGGDDGRATPTGKR